MKEMILEKIPKILRDYNRTDLLIIFLFSLVLVVPPFFYGGKDIQGKFILLALMFPLTYFIWKSRRKFDLKGILFPFVFLGIFILGMGVSIFWTPEKYQAIETFFRFLAYFLLFFLIFNFIPHLSNTSSKDEGFIGPEEPVVKNRRSPIFYNGLINYFGYLVIGLGIVLSLWGFYLFLAPKTPVRLGSTFEHHIPFGEFFTYPLLLGLVLLWLKPLKRISKILLILVNSLFLVTFFFIHSRGAWISFLLIAFLLFLFFRKYVFKKEVLISLALIFLVSLIGSYGIYQLKSARVEGPPLSQSIYGQETVKENVLTARVFFWQRALEIFKDRPLLGGGTESYIVLIKQYLRPPFYYSAYAHSFYLKVLTEQGIILFSIFLGFIFCLIYYSFRLLRKIKLNPLLSKSNLFLIGMVSGAGSAILNNSVNVGWAFSPANLLIFFFFSGIILKAYLLTQEKNQDKKNEKKNSFLTFSIFLLSLILFFSSWPFLISDFYSQKGKQLLVKEGEGKAITSFQKALKFNPINPEYNRYLYLTYLSSAKKNPENKSELLSKATYYNKKTLEWTSNLPDLNFQGEIYILQERQDLAEKSYKEAIASCPSRFVAYIELVKLYYKQNRFSDIHSLLNWVLSSYKKEYILSHLYMFPNKNIPLLQISSLHFINGKAYLNENKLKEAKEEFQKAINYFPQNESAKRNLETLKQNKTE